MVGGSAWQSNMKIRLVHFMQDNMMLRKLVLCLHMSLGLRSRVERLCKVIHTSLARQQWQPPPLSSNYSNTFFSCGVCRIVGGLLCNKTQKLRLAGLMHVNMLITLTRFYIRVCGYGQGWSCDGRMRTTITTTTMTTTTIIKQLQHHVVSYGICRMALGGGVLLCNKNTKIWS